MEEKIIDSPIHPIYLKNRGDARQVFASGIRVITWDLSTRYKSGAYNGTFAFGSIQHSLNLFSRYWNVAFQRVTRGGQYHVIQSNRDLGKNVAARSGGNTTEISPVYRFVTTAQSEMVLHHEYNHITDLAHSSEAGSIMGVNGGLLITSKTYKWYRHFQWKGTLRPENEPTFMRQYWLGAVALDHPQNMAFAESIEQIPLFKCGNSK